MIRADSAGVHIVQSPFDAPDLPWALDTVSIFGGQEEGTASFYRVRRALIDVDDRGLIYVLDSSRSRVTAFSPEGEELSTWGRQGQGPGELQSPLSVIVDHDDNVLVHDAGRGVLVRYAAGGDLLDEQAAPPVMLVSLRHVEAVPEGLLLWEREPYRGSDERTDRLILRTAEGDTPLVEGRPSYSSTAHWPACGVTFTTPLPLSPRILWNKWGERVAVSAWSDFNVNIYEGGSLTRRLVVDIPAVPLTQQAAERLLEDRGVRGPCNSSPRDFVERHGFHPNPQRVEALSLDPEGRVWAGFTQNHLGSRIMVFDPTGAALGVLPPGFPMPLTFLADGRGVISIVDSLDVERVGIVIVRER